MSHSLLQKLDAKHLEEWLRSGVPKEITALNIQSLHGVEVAQYLNISDSTPYKQKLYREVCKGGWACGGVFKPDTPRPSYKKSGEFNKYEFCSGASPSPYHVQVSEELWQAIAIKYNIAKPVDLDGWAWVLQNPSIPVAVVEGVKKAASVAVNALIPAIAVHGHNNCYKAGGDVHFSQFLDPSRIIYLVLDNDKTTEVRRNVSKSVRGVIDRLTWQENKPCTPRAKLKICKWFDGSKGIDDYFVRNGASALKKVFESAFDWSKWVDDSWSAPGYTPAITFNSQYFENIQLHSEVPLVGLIGRKGSGKTWAMEQMAQEAKGEKRPIILITHRIQLTQSNAIRLGIPYVEDVDDKLCEINQIALVIDSLWKINPQKFAGGVVFVDEIVQVIEHLNTSTTCASKRQKILKTLRDLCQVLRETGGNLVVADADLNQVTLRFLIGLLGGNIEPYIVENQYREGSYKCYMTNGYAAKAENGQEYLNPADVITTVINFARQGKRVFLGLTGQDESSRWGTINVEKMFHHFGIDSIIRIDSETTKNPDHPAFNATRKINSLCDTYQNVLVSPTGSTGISIEPQNKFDLVAIIGIGVGSADNMRQFLMRVRDTSVPRLLWVAEEGLADNYKKLGRTPEAVEVNSAKLFTTQLNLLTNHDKEWCLEFPELRVQETAKSYFNNLIAARNNEAHFYKNSVRFGLIREGVELVEIEDTSEIFPGEVRASQISDLSKTIKEQSLEEIHTQKLAAEVLQKPEYDKLKGQTTLTDAERIQLETTILSKKYGGIEITKKLLELDADGGYNKLRLHYACTVGKELHKDLDALKANKYIVGGEGNIIRNDFIDNHNLLAKTAFVEQSQVLKLLDKPHLIGSDPDCLAVHNFIVKNQTLFHLTFNHDLKNYKLQTDKFDFQVLKLLLGFLGIDSKNTGQVRINGQRPRAYQILENTDNRTEIFERWLIEDLERQTKWTERKHDRTITGLAKLIESEICLDEFKLKQDLPYFNEAWERVKTSKRISIINKVEKFELPENTVTELNPSYPEYAKYLEEIAEWAEISLDIETYGLDSKNKEGLHARKGRIRLIQISNGSKTFYVDLGGRNDNQINNIERQKPFLELLNAKCSDEKTKIIGQNIQFDLRFLRVQLGFKRARNIVDTMKGVQVFFGDYGKLKVLPGGYGLANLCEKFLGIEIDKTEQKSNWGNALTQSQIEYAAKDPFVTYHLYHRIEDLYQNPAKYGFAKLHQQGIREAWKLENDIIPCAIELEYVGLPIDREEAEENLNKCKEIQVRLLEEWKELNLDFNYTQNQKLIAHLNQKYALEIKSLNKTALADLGTLDEIKLLGRLRAIKIPIQQLESLLRSSENTGRVQTIFKTLTGTGRFSSGDSKIFKDLPNLQSISSKANPALKDYGLPSVRECIKPVTGYGLGIIDLAASHGRIAADVADDEVAIAGCNDKSIDNHSKVGAYVAKALGHDITWQELQANKMSQPYKGYRDAAKNTYYGWLNGAGAKRVQEQIKANSGQIVSLEACQAAIKGCEELYPNVVKFRQSLIADLSTKSNLLFVDGKYYAINKIKSVSNRITHIVDVKDDQIDLPYTQCLAAIWSRTEATALKRALIEIFELAEQHPEWELVPINYVHDEINITFKLEYAEKALTAVNNIIGDNFAETLNKVSDGRESNWKKLLVNNWSEK